MLTGKLIVDLDKRYEVKEAAKALGCSRKTLDNYVRRGLIHPTIHVSGQIFFWGHEIKRFYDYTI